VYHNRTPIALWLLVTLLIDAAISAYPHWHVSWHFHGAAFLALMLGQTSLAGIWLSLGRTPGPLRTLGVIGIIGAWSFLFACLNGSQIEEMFVTLMIPLAIISASLLAARWRGLQCVDLYDPAPHGRNVFLPWQFSIGNLLGWTAIVAIILGVSKGLGLFALPPQLPQGECLVFSGLGHATVAFAGLWAVLGARSPILRLPAVALAAMVAVETLCVVESHHRMVFPILSWLLTGDLRFLKAPKFHDIGFSATLMSVETLYLVGSLLVFRKLGYRVRWNGNRELTTGMNQAPWCADSSSTRRRWASRW